MLPRTGFVIFAKRDCPTCELIEPVLQQLSGTDTCLISQDDPAFPRNVSAVLDDRELEQSWRHNIEFVPTLIRMEKGREVDRTYGWDVREWRRITGQPDLGKGLPEFQPGCGSLSVAPGAAEHLQVRYGESGLKSRKIELGDWDDPIEACFERGWSDGLPVVPPTDVRILRMLSGTKRKPDEIIGRIPPFLPECTVEKVAISAVMAGCKPEYMPLVLAVVETALVPYFSLHGILATTSFGGPIVIGFDLGFDHYIERRLGLEDRLDLDLHHVRWLDARRRQRHGKRQRIQIGQHRRQRRLHHQRQRPGRLPAGQLIIALPRFAPMIAHPHRGGHRAP